MPKVYIEIDEKGWLLKVKTNTDEFIEKGVITETGASHSGNIGDLEEVNEELYESVVNDNFYIYEIANALSEKN